ncbi:MAG: hypothetical protein F2663_07305 [Actinobacteria bacterium]|uniref:Unannotated protein n=1 Tax=freshwater metagenome TaxID=449393 RepID=A0A6J6Q4L2_9ZZZZ|nr:hypothetical protein [Actinomycetota bacterium]
MDEAELGAAAFEDLVREAFESIPSALHELMENVEVVVEDEPPHGEPLLGFYQGVPLTARGAFYAAALPDKITIFRGPIERAYGADHTQLRAQVRRTVLHEVAHHFGISDERLVEIDRY